MVKNKEKKDEYKESFKSWAKIKFSILGAIIGVIVVIWGMRWIVVIPYHTFNYLNIGHWGIIIGSILMFIIVNIPVGLLSVCLKLDDEEIFNIEMTCATVSLVITGITYLAIYASWP